MLHTARLVLRRLTLQDAEAFHTIWGDTEVIWWGAMPDVGATRVFLAKVLKRVEGDEALGWFAIVHRQTRRLIGDVVLQPSHWGDAVEIGWHVAKGEQNKGYATEAAHALLNHARTHGIRHVEAVIVPDNAASHRVAAHLGMRRTGHTVQQGGLEHELLAIDLD